MSTQLRKENIIKWCNHVVIRKLPKNYFLTKILCSCVNPRQGPLENISYHHNKIILAYGTLMFHGDYLPASISILMLFKTYMWSFYRHFYHSVIILLEYDRECSNYRTKKLNRLSLQETYVIILRTISLFSFNVLEYVIQTSGYYTKINHSNNSWVQCNKPRKNTWVC